MRSIFFALSFLLSLQLGAALPELSELFSKNLNIKLESPVYKDGVTSTDQGGVVTGQDLYLQAKHMKYIKREEDGKMVRRIEASGELFFHHKNRIYTGDRLDFDLDNQTAVIYNVQTDAGLWFLGGSKLMLNKDGSGVIEDCRMTTEENSEDDWMITAKEVHLSKNNTVKAQNVRFTVMTMPVFWIPSLTKDLNNDTMSPIRYRVGYYGHKNVRLGLSYDFDTGKNWKNRALVDISTLRGLAGGFVTEYKNPDKKEERFRAFNYYAHDIATNDSDRDNRYRFQGRYDNLLFDNKIGLKATYDKMSDPVFPSDFENRGLDNAKAIPTQIEFSRKEPNWISTLNTKVRVNDYQTVKQELPMLRFAMRPVELGDSKVVLDNRASCGYLNYLYAHNTPDVHNFHSARFDVAQKAYRPFPVGIFSFTPQAGYRAIAYGNSPQHDSKLLAQGIVGAELHTRFKRETPLFTHALEPYGQYEYYSKPTINPHKHYLFDLQDGLYRQNSLRFGTRNFIICDRGDLLNFDLYARAFYNTPTIGSRIPKAYLDAVYRPSGFVEYSLKSAWDMQHNMLDHGNVRADITFTEDLAFAVEYRHRSPYAWRKLDYDNFMIDTFRRQHSLKHSLMSDRRDTFLAHMFLRLSPELALDLRTRHGWGRKHAKNYTEYEINCITLIRNAIRLTFTFRHRATGNDYSVNFAFGNSSQSADTSFKRINQGNYTLP